MPVHLVSHGGEHVALQSQLVASKAKRHLQLRHLLLRGRVLCLGALYELLLRAQRRLERVDLTVCGSRLLSRGGQRRLHFAIALLEALEGELAQLGLAG